MSKKHITGFVIAVLFLLTLAYAELTTLPFTKNLVPAGSSLTESATTTLPAEFALSGDAGMPLEKGLWVSGLPGRTGIPQGGQAKESQNPQGVESVCKVLYIRLLFRYRW